MFHFFIISGSSDPLISLNQQLETAVKKGKIVEVRALLAQGADPNYKNPKGKTLLILSVETRRSKTKPKVVKELLDNYADINFQDPQGNTAVHIAVTYKRPTILQTLLAANPDPFITNKHGEKASDLVNINYPVSDHDFLIRNMLTEYKKNRKKQAEKERVATTCMIQECGKYNTGISNILQYLLDTPKYPVK